MPTISIEFDDMLQLIGCNRENDTISYRTSQGEKKELQIEELLHKLAMLGSDVGDINEGILEAEFFPNRPDMYSVEGVARSLRAFLEIQPGLRKYEVKESDIVMNVEESILNVRPFIGAALIKGVTMTDPLIQSIMGIQEKLHITLGRNRVKVAIGVHDYEYIEPPFTYKAIHPSDITFIPLDMDQEMDLKEILMRHDKGKDYAFTLEQFDRYPIIIDKKWDVLSFPPIINGELTAVSEETKDIFLDITGNDRNSVYYALNIMATMLAERGGTIYSVEVAYPDHSETLPNLSSQRISLEQSMVDRYLGEGIDKEKIIECLSLTGHEVNYPEGKTDNIGNNIFLVDSPPYRTDILHPIDIIEDIAIGFGYDKFPMVLPKGMTFGNPLALESLCYTIREFFIGQDFWK